MGKVLVTGANGFIGSHLCEAFLREGYDVRGLVRQSSDLKYIRSLNIELVYGDLSDTESLKKAVFATDIVINNAGLTKTLNNKEFTRANVDGVRNILEAIVAVNPGIRKFIQISSQAAAGPSPGHFPINEDTTPHPLTAYGKSKLEGEKAAFSFTEKLPVTILRPSAVYGPRDVDMFAFFKTVKMGFKPTFGMGRCYSNFAYVKDLATAAVAAAEAVSGSGATYFVAEKKYYSYKEAGAIVSEEFGSAAINIHVPVTLMILAGKVNEFLSRLRRQPTIFTAEKAWEISRKFWLVDCSKMERELGFVCPTSFRDGVRESLDWYRRHKWL